MSACVADDYTELQNAIVVLNGQKTSELVNVSITNDDSLEADESFTVELVLLSAPLNDSSRVIVSPSTASLEITNDDGMCVCMCVCVLVCVCICKCLHNYCTCSLLMEF